MPYLMFVLCCLFPVWIFLHDGKNTKHALAQIREKKNHQGEKLKMLKLLESLIGKPCTVHTIDNDYDGTLEKLEDGCIVLKDRYYSSLVFVNPDYVVGVVERKEKKKKEKKEKQPVEQAE